MQHLVKAFEGRKMRREECPSTPLKPFWSELSTGGCCLCREWGFLVPAVEWHSWSQGMCCASAWSVQNQHLYLCRSRNVLFLFKPLWTLSALPLTLTHCPGFPGVYPCLSPPFQQPHLIVHPRIHHPAPRADPPPGFPIFAALTFL